MERAGVGDGAGAVPFAVGRSADGGAGRAPGRHRNDGVVRRPARRHVAHPDAQFADQRPRHPRPGRRPAQSRRRSGQWPAPAATFSNDSDPFRVDFALFLCLSISIFFF